MIEDGRDGARPSTGKTRVEGHGPRGLKKNPASCDCHAGLLAKEWACRGSALQAAGWRLVVISCRRWIA